MSGFYDDPNSPEEVRSQPIRTTPRTPVTEEDFLLQVTQLAELRGWSWVHFRPAQTRAGWRTPVQGPLGAGWPDLVLARPRDRRVVFVELKADGAQPRPEQTAVLDVLHDAGATVHIWRPGDWEAVEAILR